MVQRAPPPNTAPLGHADVRLMGRKRVPEPRFGAVQQPASIVIAIIARKPAFAPNAEYLELIKSAFACDNAHRIAGMKLLSETGTFRPSWRDAGWSLLG
jgi:hypothetical protein